MLIGRENADCWCGKAGTRQSRMEAQEGRMLTAGAGMENTGCGRRNEECSLLVQEGRLLTTGRENADCWCRKGEC